MTQHASPSTDHDQVDGQREIPANPQELNLSKAERRVFFDVLMNPPEPTDRLKRAFELHRQRVRSDV